MELIAHRGNIFGPQPEIENSPEYIDEAIRQLYKAEIDLWSVRGELFLGHDSPIYLIDFDYLFDRRDFIYVHLKGRFEEGNACLINDLNWFKHHDERFVFTNFGDKWYFPSAEIMSDGVNLMPEYSSTVELFISKMNRDVRVCSDYVGEIKRGFQQR